MYSLCKQKTDFKLKFSVKWQHVEDFNHVQTNEP